MTRIGIQTLWSPIACGRPSPVVVHRLWSPIVCGRSARDSLPSSSCRDACRLLPIWRRAQSPRKPVWLGVSPLRETQDPCVGEGDCGSSGWETGRLRMGDCGRLRMGDFGRLRIPVSTPCWTSCTRKQRTHDGFNTRQDVQGSTSWIKSTTNAAAVEAGAPPPRIPNASQESGMALSGDDTDEGAAAAQG
jgi:hypothetical protein